MTTISKTPSPGDVVLTTYGVAVVIKISDSLSPSSSCSFKARLWREPGKSVGSSATAFLNTTSILKELPAAPGMVTTLKVKDDDDDGSDEVASNGDSNPPRKQQAQQQNVLIHRYSPWNDTYLVSNIYDDDEVDDSSSTPKPTSTSTSPTSKSPTSKSPTKSPTSTTPDREGRIIKQPELFEVTSSETAGSKSGKFYPLIDELIHRGNEASASAQAAIKHNPKINELISLSGSSLTLNNTPTNTGDSSDTGDNESQSDELLKKGDQILRRGEQAVTSTLKKNLPTAKEASEIYTMLKDEELTSLLSRGRQRLRQLASGDIPDATLAALRSIGVEIQPPSSSSTPTVSETIVLARTEALTALDTLLSKNLDTSVSDLHSSLASTFSTAFDSLSTAASSDNALSSIVEDITEKTTEWQEQTGRLLETKSSCLFFEGARRP